MKTNPSDEVRDYRVLGLASCASGHKSHWARCPFCERKILLYWWSVAGHGKRCICGAMFWMDGTASMSVKKTTGGES